MTSSFNNYVIKSILVNNQFGIASVMDIQSLASGNFKQEDYHKIDAVIRRGELKLINNLLKDQEKSGAYLGIMKFKDQNDSQYLVMVYDSDQLHQDPQVIEIYKLK